MMYVRMSVSKTYVVDVCLCCASSVVVVVVVVVVDVGGEYW